MRVTMCSTSYQAVVMIASADDVGILPSWVEAVVSVCSDLVEGSDIDWLDEVIHSLNLLLEVVGGNFLIFNDATNDDLLDTVGNGGLLVLGLPEETFHLDGNDLLGELIEVGLSLIGLDLEDDEWLGNWLFLDLLDVGLLGFLKLLLGFLYYYLLVPIK